MLLKGSVKEVCSHQKDSGPCRAALKRFYYDLGSHSCKSFIYGGCQGNDNNFATLNKCEETCVKNQKVSADDSKNLQAIGLFSFI